MVHESHADRYKNSVLCLSRLRSAATAVAGTSANHLITLDSLFPSCALPLSSGHLLPWPSWHLLWLQNPHYLQQSMPLLSGHKKIVTIDDVEFSDQEVEFFDIRLDDDHTYFVSAQDIVVHNISPFFIGF